MVGDAVGANDNPVAGFHDAGVDAGLDGRLAADGLLELVLAWVIFGFLGRELAQLLRADYPRLSGILRRCLAPSEVL